MLTWKERLPVKLSEAIRGIVDSITQKQWDQLIKNAPNNPVSWSDIDRELDSYGARFSTLPVDYESAIYFGMLQPKGYWIDCPLWTVEHEMSDLEVQMNATPCENSEGWDVQVIDVRTP